MTFGFRSRCWSNQTVMISHLHVQLWQFFSLSCPFSVVDSYYYFHFWIYLLKIAIFWSAKKKWLIDYQILLIVNVRQPKYQRFYSYRPFPCINVKIMHIILVWRKVMDRLRFKVKLSKSIRFSNAFYRQWWYAMHPELTGMRTLMRGRSNLKASVELLASIVDGPMCRFH